MIVCPPIRSVLSSGSKVIRLVSMATSTPYNVPYPAAIESSVDVRCFGRGDVRVIMPETESTDSIVAN